MKNRKKHIALIIFLALITTVFASETIKQANGDVKAPFLLKQAVEVIIKANPEAGNRHLGWCGTPSGMHIMSFQNVFWLARTEDVIPFLEHRAEYVRHAVHGILHQRGNKANRAIKRAYKNGSARIKLELLPYVNPEATPDEKLKLLSEIIENDKLKIFQTDTRYLTSECRYNKYKTLDEYPIDIIKFYLKMMETDFIPDKVIAISGLGNLGAVAAPVVPVFIEILKGKDHGLEYGGVSMMGFGDSQTLHSVVITALGNIGAAAFDAVPLIESKLDTNVYGDIINIRVSLYKIDKDKEKHLKFIFDEFNNQPPGENLEIVMSGLSWIGSDASPALPKLIEIAKTADKSTRAHARVAIAGIEGSFETPKKILLEGIRSEDKQFRLECVEALHGKSNDPEIKTALFNVIENDPDPDVCYRVFEELYSYGREKENTAKYLIKIINADPQGVHAQDAADKIRWFENFDFSEAVPGMLNLLSGQQDYKIGDNIKTIIKIGGTYDQIVAKLVEISKSEDDKVASSAITQLGKLGPNAYAALLPLHEIYQTRGKHVDRNAKNAIQNIVKGLYINEDISPDILIQVMDCLDQDQLLNVVNRLTAAGVDFQKIVPKLSEMTKLSDTSLSSEAMKILESHGSGSMGALSQLAGLGSSGDYQANLSIMNILKSVNSQTKADVKDILPIFWTKNERASLEAAEAVFRLTGSYDAAADELIKVLEKGSLEQRQTAVKTLGMIGGGANKALPALNAELTKPDTV
ncbi:MAG: hypothetical protein ABIG42_05345, partial [bacterium]